MQGKIAITAVGMEVFAQVKSVALIA